MKIFKAINNWFISYYRIIYLIFISVLAFILGYYISRINKLDNSIILKNLVVLITPITISLYFFVVHVRRLLKDRKMEMEIMAKLKDIQPLLDEIADVVEKKMDSDDNKIFISLDDTLKTAFLQYTIFFNEFLKVVKSIEYSILTDKTDKGITIIFPKKEDVDANQIKNWFEEYFNYLKSNISIKSTKFETDILEKDKNIFLLRLENQIINLKQDYKILATRNKELKEDKEFFKKLALNISSQQHNPIINNHLNIEGPKISIDKIINESSVLNETDKAFIDLIHKNTSSEEERKALIKSLEDVKSEDTTTEEKQKSGSLLKKFLETGVSESSKMIVREIIETGGAYLDFIF